jgi:hypothetical protein
MIAKQDVDQSISSHSRHARHPCLPLACSYRRLQPFLPGTMPGLDIRSERLRRRRGPRSGASPRRCCPCARLTRVSTALGRRTRSPVCMQPAYHNCCAESRPDRLLSITAKDLYHCRPASSHSHAGLALTPMIRYITRHVDNSTKTR